VRLERGRQREESSEAPAHDEHRAAAGFVGGERDDVRQVLGEVR
jgi:hypothetical protein